MGHHYTSCVWCNLQNQSGNQETQGATFIANEKVEMGTYCGAKIPPMLMSSDLELSLTFTSDSTAVAVRGFKATYSFVTSKSIL